MFDNYIICPGGGMMDIASICRERRKRRERILEIRAKIARKRREKKVVRLIPRYDEVFFNGVAELFGELVSNQEPLSD